MKYMHICDLKHDTPKMLAQMIQNRQLRKMIPEFTDFCHKLENGEVKVKEEKG
eukprot:CAMPEP_0170480074 /NCGR_PEP_ID=MMETSP0208-20121228/1052_1 /TAXON_ID=197538 /ORGANISM="Strombidium inclinatum, Strain S3" /LENGTH=52 /DNA_ID=CAMNT_0010752557 /DNA_START=437 /DNA_END=591 /DNA_ORIENTATION=-